MTSLEASLISEIDSQSVCGFSHVPTDVIAYIFSFLPKPSKLSGFESIVTVSKSLGIDCEGLYPDEVPNQVRTGSTFFKMRLVCKQWNEAAIRCNSQWSYFLARNGPKIITEKSVHHSGRDCKINSKTNRCTIAAHYENLFFKYDPNNQVGAYKTTMSIFGKKYEKKKSAEERSLEKQLKFAQSRVQDIETKIIELKIQVNRSASVSTLTENRFRKKVKTAERHLQTTKTKVSDLKRRYDEAEEKLEHHNDHYDRFVKKRKTKKSKSSKE